MSVALITGSCGLIGSEAACYFHDKGLDIVGIDNNLRKYFFGNDGSVDWNTRRLQSTLERYKHLSIDIRDQKANSKIFKQYGQAI